jgi:type I restriction enzyme R subunit
MDPSRLYESPFTDFNPKGADGLFDSQSVDKLISVLDQVRQRAIA